MPVSLLLNSNLTLELGWDGMLLFKTTCLLLGSYYIHLFSRALGARNQRTLFHFLDT